MATRMAEENFQCSKTDTYNLHGKRHVYVTSIEIKTSGDVYQHQCSSYVDASLSPAHAEWSLEDYQRREQAKYEFKEQHISQCQMRYLVMMYMTKSIRYAERRHDCMRVHALGDCSVLSGGSLSNSYRLHHCDVHYHPLALGQIDMTHWNGELYQCYEEAQMYPGGVVILRSQIKITKTKNKEFSKILTAHQLINERGGCCQFKNGLNLIYLLPRDTRKYTTTCPTNSNPLMIIEFDESVNISKRQFEKLQYLWSVC